LPEYFLFWSNMDQKPSEHLYQLIYFIRKYREYFFRGSVPVLPAEQGKYWTNQMLSELYPDKEDIHEKHKR